MNIASVSSVLCSALLSCAAAGLLGSAAPARAALTELASEPLPTLVTTQAKPNILFVLDNSGSMGWDYMPDDVRNAASDHTNTYGYKSAQCNGVAFDPDYTYTPPLKADGTSYPNASFTAANPNGYGPTLADGKAYYSNSNVTTGGGSKTFVFTGGVFAGGGNWLNGIPSWSVGDTITAVDVDDENHWVIGTITGFNSSGDPLCWFYCKATVTINVTSFNGSDAASDWRVNKLQVDNLVNSTYFIYNTAVGSQKRMDWTYNVSGVEDTLFKQECVSKVGDAKGKGFGKFIGVTLTTNSPAALKQNYANWYQYYRTRMLMMRSAAGRAFQPLGDRYRIGFMTINSSDLTERTALKDISAGNAFLNVRDYTSAQRALFMERLYNTSANGGTPLRTALSRAGQYYAKAISGQSYDPVQYACQRHYTFLSTDGYWNDSGNPKRLDRSTDIGQQDGLDVRPFNDGGSGTSRAVTTTTERKETRTPVTVTQNYMRTDYTYVAGTFFSPAAGCTALSPVKQTATVYTGATTVSGDKVETQDWVSTTTVETITKAGAQTSTTSTAGPVMTNPATTMPSPSTPATFTAGPSSSTCQSGGASRPASTGVAPFGNAIVAPAGPAVTTTVSTTTAGPTTTVVSSSGGTSNTLADVAQYYYNTDLRTPALGNCTAGPGGAGNVCDNSQVKAVGRDTATWQHMSTFTLGLGVNGTLPYDRDYLTRANDPASTYYKIIKGGPGGLDWPAPAADKSTTIDDLWHAAVNGRGQYFGAKNADDLTAALNSALSTMGRVPGAGAAAGPTGIRNTDSAYLAFAATYVTVDWVGNVQAYPKGQGGSTAPPLAADGQSGVQNLARRNATQTDRRTIYYGTGASSTLKSFNALNLSADNLLSHFEGFCGKSVSDGGTVYPAQCAALSADQKTAANTGVNLVNWLRGQADHEESNANFPLYRKRDKVLGDIVNSVPVYLPYPFPYTDPGYAAFKAAKSGRKVVYVGANDGMLHAFSAANDSNLGKELWAFVPNAVMPKMFRLANTDYANRHQYFVDGTPVIGDINAGGAWRTILVGGLNSGGQAIYALDVTDPDAPKKLWEFTDAQLGYTYGKPLITKLPSGRWVAVFASGYNNASGKGYMYVVDAYSGVQLTRVATTAGSAATPSGLAHLNMSLDSVQDNTAQRFYGGDLLGNVWRFTLSEGADGKVSGAAQRLALLQLNATTPQPVSTRPELAQVGVGAARVTVVLIGTGRYLGAADVSDSARQSLYAIKDPLGGTDWGDVRSSNKLVAATLSVSGDKVKAGATGVNWASDIGWRIDLMTARERIYSEMKLQYTTLVAVAGVPGSGSACAAGGGQGWLYTIDVETGGTLPGADSIGHLLGDGMPMGLAWSEGEGGDSGVLVTNSDGSTTRVKVPVKNSAGTPKLRRASWRELFSN